MAVTQQHAGSSSSCHLPTSAEKLHASSIQRTIERDPVGGSHEQCQPLMTSASCSQVRRSGSAASVRQESQAELPLQPQFMAVLASGARLIQAPHLAPKKQLQSPCQKLQQAMASFLSEQGVSAQAHTSSRSACYAHGCARKLALPSIILTTC